MFKNSDLDVYVNVKREPALDSALRQTGYDLHADLTKEGGAVELDDNALLLAMETDEMILRTKYVFSAIASVKEYHNQGGKVVQVIASHGPPMDIILGFHSSYYFAYCLYPSTTIRDRVSVAHIGDDMNTVRAREKWEHRGWRMLKESTSSAHLDLRTVNRYVGDCYSWRIPCEGQLTLDDVLIHSPSRLTDVLKAHSWQLLYPHLFDDGFYAIYAWLLLPPFQKIYGEVVAKVRNLPNQLAGFDSSQAIAEAFIVDYQNSDDFVFVANAESGEEEVFQVHGIISETRLPPVQKGNRCSSVSMTGLVQTVKLVSIEDNQEFRTAAVTISRMCEFLQQSVGAPVQAPYAVQHGITREITFVNRLLTPTHSAFPEDIITLPSAFDPSQSLKASIDEGKFAFTKDNQVAFNKLALNEEDDQ
ncbi:hypothetical protein ARMGADRAFT_1023041 [Armillaria gallica]|uniref:Uncharacterized protein n=1 Tax=Armillaria gallica TaxID=47427 RepID=A0A2H3E5G3_ARMGA|nr:hypothetical protein ARMGADRAFT_1023041 [Armillaria gallica]